MKNGFKAVVGAAVFFVCLGLAVPEVHAGVRSLRTDLSSGYRNDDFTWNIGGYLDPSKEVNVLSELAWKDLEIFQVKTSGQSVFTWSPLPFPIYLQGTFDYGWILHGDNRDSDFAGPNRTQEFSRSNNKADGDDVFDLSIGAGPQFVLPAHFTVTPLAGYSFSRQELTLTDGYQSISQQVDTSSGTVMPPPVGPLPGLDSRYRANWWGPWLGMNLDYPLSKKLSMSGGFQYHFADYYADATWNLRNEGAFALAQPKSFEHEGSGYGLLFSFRGNYRLSSRWTFSLQATYQEWKVAKGTDRIFLADGKVGVSPLNEVNWRSRSVMLGATYRFF